MRKGPAPSTVPHGEAPTAPDAGGSTKKRKRAPNESAALGANAAKRAAIAAEAALGPLPTIWKEGATRRFVPWLMPEGLFDDDRPGERWAAHPDYPPSKLLVSYNYGVVRTRGHAAVGAYECFTQGSMGKQGYRSTKHKYVHILVCEAFHGPKPPGGNCTVDHGAKYNGDFMRERSDNRACNLKWATPREQLKNQKAHSAHSNGVPVLARLKDSTDDADWCSYASSFAAGKALGISPGGIISAVLDETKKNTVTRPAATIVFRHDLSSLEPQTDLLAEELGPPHARYCVPVEQWKLDPESGGRTWASTRGRVQTQNPTGGGFGSKRTPRPTAGQEYTSVRALSAPDRVAHLLPRRSARGQRINRSQGPR